MLLGWISKIYFKIAGWELVGDKPPFDKYIFIVAPHTSQRDFLFGIMFCAIKGIKPRVLVKKEAFFFPLGIILRWMGGVPVDRKSNQHLAEQMIEQFNASKEFALVIAPEGTRKRVTRWKKGFYHIARHANVPIVMAYMDYKTRRMGVGPSMMPSDDYNEDIQKIKSFYRGMHGKYPERFTADD